MSKIITAEEFLKSQGCNYILQKEKLYFSDVTKDDLIEFAKLHIKAALKEASENIPGFGSSTDIPDWGEVEKEVLNSYPLENIK